MSDKPTQKQQLKAMIYEIERKPDGVVVYRPVTSAMWLSVSMIAATVGVCKQTVYREIETGRLRASRFGATVRVEVEAFREWIEQSRESEYDRPMPKPRMTVEG